MPPRHHDRRNTSLDALQAVNQVDRVNGQVANIGNIRQPKWLDARDVVCPAHQAGLAAHLSRPLSCPRTVGGAAIPGDPHKRDIKASCRGDGRQSHKGRMARETYCPAAPVVPG
jgi:hypothetical protein